jgi:hypothetical protein
MKSRASQLNERLNEGTKRVSLSEEMDKEIDKMDTNGVAAVAEKLAGRLGEIMDMEGEAPFPASDEDASQVKIAKDKIASAGKGLIPVKEKQKK